MNIHEIYLLAVQRVNENITNGNIELDQSRFVMLFNNAQLQLMRYFLHKKNEDSIRMIQRFKVYGKELELIDSKKDQVFFKLPNGFLDFVNVDFIAAKGRCIARSAEFEYFEAKSENVDKLMVDQINRPSYEYRSTFYTLGSDRIQFFVDDFTIKNVYLTYYRYPRRISMNGVIDYDGNIMPEVNPEFDDNELYQILDILAKNFSLSDEDYNRFQAEQMNISASH